MLLILTIVRFTVFGLVKRWFKSWVAVDLMDVFQTTFNNISLMWLSGLIGEYRVKISDCILQVIDKLDDIKLYIEFTSLRV